MCPTAAALWLLMPAAQLAGNQGFKAGQRRMQAPKLLVSGRLYSSGSITGGFEQRTGPVEYVYGMARAAL